VASTDAPADTRAKPPLEVVAPILAVDSRARRSGYALDERAARAKNRPGRQPKWVPLLLVVRSRMTSTDAPGRYARETTTGSGGTHLGCRLARAALGLRPRRARSARAPPSTSAQRERKPSGSSAQMGATTSSSAESDGLDRRAWPVRARNHHWNWWHPFGLSTRTRGARASLSTSAQRER